MTPEDFEKIALWMGWRKEKGHWWSDEFHMSRGLVSEVTSLTDAEAVEALNRLVEKGYAFELVGIKNPAEYHLELRTKGLAYKSKFQPTIHAAAEQAILELAKREG